MLNALSYFRKNPLPQRMETFSLLIPPGFPEVPDTPLPSGFQRQKSILFSLKAHGLNVCIILFLVRVLYVNRFFESSPKLCSCIGTKLIHSVIHLCDLNNIDFYNKWIG